MRLRLCPSGNNWMCFPSWVGKNIAKFLCQKFLAHFAQTQSGKLQQTRQKRRSRRSVELFDGSYWSPSSSGLSTKRQTKPFTHRAIDTDSAQRFAHPTERNQLLRTHVGIDDLLALPQFFRGRLNSDFSNLHDKSVTCIF